MVKKVVLFALCALLLLFLAACDDDDWYQVMCGNPKTLREKFMCWMIQNDKNGKYDDHREDKPPTCADSDGGYLDRQGTVEIENSKGKTVRYTDYCVNGKQLHEYQCNLGTTFTEFTADCGPDANCRNGACLSRTSGCADTDGGRNTARKGVAEGYLTTSTESKEYTDSCWTQYSVTEYFCSQGYVTSEIISCSGGESCVNGECRKGEPKPFYDCEDLDNGKDIQHYGSSTTGDDGKGVFISDSDRCVDEHTIREGFCDDKGFARWEVMSCGNLACSNGECVPNS